MQTPTHEFEAYFAGIADEQQLRAVESWIQADPSHARAFIEHLHFRELLGQHLRERYNETGSVLAELAQLEAQANASTVTLLGELRVDEPKFANSLSAHDFAAVAGYLLRQCFTKKRVITTSLCGVAAAVVLLALVLLNPFANEAPDTLASVPTAPNPPASDSLDPVVEPVVATLSAEHNAHWEHDFDYGTPEPGDDFYVGRELILISGFAELTTATNAVVVLEGPCTVAFDSPDNAMRLEAGRLVAEVPAEAVGFTVHTPTARVIDYGTRFGVEVRADGSTNAAVFTGEIELREISEQPTQPMRNVRLTQGWSAAVSRHGVLQREPKRVNAEDHARFAQSLDAVTTRGFDYRRAVLSSKPLVYWSFDEAAASTRNLAGLTGFDGRAMGQVDHGQGLFGKALQLTGQLDAMGGFASEKALPFEDVQAYTLEAWCWIDRPHHGRVLALVELGDGGDERSGHLGVLEVLGGQAVAGIVKHENDSVRFVHRNPPSPSSNHGSNIFSGQAAPVGQWVHLVAVKDGSKTRIYLDGEPVAVSDDNQPVATDRPLDLFVGVSPIMLHPSLSKHATDFRPFAGRIDEVAVYDRALSHDTIRNHFSLGQSRLND